MGENIKAAGERMLSIPSIEDLMVVVTELENKMKEGIHRTINLEKEIRIRTEERDVLKVQNQKLEEENEELKKRQKLTISESQEVSIMKEKSEEVLTRAKSIIFEKTKVCKNQELQIEALSQQVASLKEVVSITKDLLEIRNMEVKHLQDQINLMDQKINTEKERQDIVHEKLDKMMSLNTELKGEYQTQLCLFNALRQRYSEKELSKGILKAVPSNTEANQANNNEVNPELQKEEVQVLIEVNLLENGNVPEDALSTTETSDVESQSALSTIDESSSNEKL